MKRLKCKIKHLNHIQCTLHARIYCNTVKHLKTRKDCLMQGCCYCKKKLSGLINKFSLLLIEGTPAEIMSCAQSSTTPCVHGYLASCLQNGGYGSEETVSSRFSAQHYNTLFQLLYLWQPQQYRSCTVCILKLYQEDIFFSFNIWYRMIVKSCVSSKLPDALVCRPNVSRQCGLFQPALSGVAVNADDGLSFVSVKQHTTILIVSSWGMEY